MFATLNLARMLAASLAALAMLSQATAEPLAARNGYPGQPIRFISPFPPGGGNDASTRWVTTRLTEATGQPSVVENRGGAGGNIGAKAVAEAKPDGYTVLTGQVSLMAVNPALYSAPGFDPLKNFVPITQINADRYLPVDAGSIPMGELADVTGTPFDLRQSTVIGDSIDVPHEQLRIGRGYDHNFVLNHQAEQGLKLAASVRDPQSGRVMQVYTQEPGVQFYSGNFLDGSQHGKLRAHSYRSALCLETQHFPDSPNQSHFPNNILRPGQVYQTHTVYRFSAE